MSNGNKISNITYEENKTLVETKNGTFKININKEKINGENPNLNRIKNANVFRSENGNETIVNINKNYYPATEITNRNTNQNTNKTPNSSEVDLAELKNITKNTFNENFSNEEVKQTMLDLNSLSKTIKNEKNILQKKENELERIKGIIANKIEQNKNKTNNTNSRKNLNNNTV